MKKLVTIACIGIALFAANVSAQKGDDKSAVLAVVQKLFDEMAAANAPGILATGTADNQLVTIQKMRDGKTRISAINGEQFTKFFTKPGAIKEVMYDPQVHVDGDWAMVWGRYVFFAGDKLSHCGINQFNMVRTEAGWKIANGASTIDPGACNEKENVMKP
jgi:ketosteroid isomerase-like protein